MRVIKIADKRDKEYLVDKEDLPEFNMMAYYNIRMDKRSDERDLALNNGDLDQFKRCTMSILMNAIPRFRSKAMPDEDIEKLKTEFIKIGSRISSMSLANENVIKKNAPKMELELWHFNIRLNDLMFKYGMIFPEKEIRDLKEMIAEDF